MLHLYSLIHNSVHWTRRISSLSDGSNMSEKDKQNTVAR